MMAGVYANRGEPAKAASFTLRAAESHLRAGDRNALGSQMAWAAVLLAGAGVDEPAAMLFGTHPVANRLGVTEQGVAHLAEAEAALRGRLGDECFETTKARGAAMDDNQVASLMRVELNRIGETEMPS
jgi:hypothetical protein